MKGPIGTAERHCLLALALLLASTAGAARERQGPEHWLERMSQAVASIDYQGTVIRRQNGETQALKVMHKVVDGVVNERIISQEGSGLEIIRIGNEVHCILPDKKSVLIEQWNDRSTLFSTLPTSDVRFGGFYDVSLVREERVAGRPAVLVAIRPHDSYRFGHRLWLDRETALPLRTELVGADGDVIEQLKFADISLTTNLSAQALRPSTDVDSFTWYAEPARTATVDVGTDWVCEDLPPGFQAISTREEKLPGAAEPVTHIVYGDGLATVSVFITRETDEEIARRSVLGSSNSFSIRRDGYQITAIGEVPAETVQRIATAMHVAPGRPR